MKIMIHACPQRMWYVSEFLVPQLRDQGVGEDEITVWNDTDGWGNLESFVRSCESLRDIHRDFQTPAPQAESQEAAAAAENRSMWGREASPHTWHIQDDVLLAHDFVARARTLERETDGIVCGFVCDNWGPKPIKEGIVPMPFMWNGFQCLRIPDRIAAEFAVWFRGAGYRKPELQRWVSKNKGDDSIFRAFCLERHGSDTVRNINPNLADHVDFLIGGTVLNQARPCQYNRALLLDPRDAAAVAELRDRLARRALDQATKQAIEEIDAGAKKTKARRKKKSDA